MLPCGTLVVSVLWCLMVLVATLVGCGFLQYSCGLQLRAICGPSCIVVCVDLLCSSVVQGINLSMSNPVRSHNAFGMLCIY